jgi:hypothetical protein
MLKLQTSNVDNSALLIHTITLYGCTVTSAGLITADIGINVVSEER